MLAFLLGCNEYVKKSELVTVQQELKKTQAELAKTNDTLAKAKAQEHKYSTFPRGFRVWRFDATTGRTCILLTTDADWQKQSTASQSCGCADAMDDPTLKSTLGLCDPDKPHGAAGR
jgi:hypothetical protein